MKTLAIALVLLAAPSTHDVVPVIVGGSGQTFGWDYVSTAGRGAPRLADELRAFRRPRDPFRDLLPASVQAEVRIMALGGFGGSPGRSRLLLRSGAIRIYGLPGRDGQVCVHVVPKFRLQCWYTLQHGAAPVVDARRDVWGLLGNDARRVDVEFAARTVRAVVGDNAFYLPMPRHEVAPQRIVVTDRDDARHVYTVLRCTVDDLADSFFPVADPLAPPPTPC